MKAYHHIALMLLLLAAQMASAQWPTSPDERLFVGYGIQSRIVSDGEGGAFVIFTNYPGSSWNNCYLQKLDRYGYPQFSYPLQLELGYGDYRHFLMVSDGCGGAIIALREYNWENEDYKLGIFRFDQAGNSLYWNVTPAIPEVSPQYSYIIASDSLGGVYILYCLASADLRIQHLGPNGERLWGDEGIFLDIGSPFPFSHWISLGADLDYCYATSNGDSLQRHAFKFTPEGDPVWGFTGRSFNPLGENNELTPDGTGGLVEICRSGTSGTPLRAYRFDSEGNWVWDEGGVTLGSMYHHKGVICRYPAIFICWTTADYPHHSKLQKLDYQGNYFWQEDLHIFSTYNSQGELCMRDVNNTGLVFGCGMMIPPDESGFFAQKYSYDGQRLWSENDVCIADGQGVTQYSLYLSSNDFGGSLFSWEEIDPLWGQRICAAMVNAQGELGVVGVAQDHHEALITGFSLLPCFPNPFNSSTVIRFTLSAPSCVELGIFDIAGRAVGERQEGWYGAGVNRILFDGSKLPSSLYLARLEAGLHQAVRKLVLLK